MILRRLDRYLLREAATAWLAVIVVLLAIMLSSRFARFLALAARGDLPRELLFKVVGLSSLEFLVVLVPVSLLLAIMLALGRLYRDSEVAAMTGCGVGLAALYRPFVVLGLLLALFTAALSFQIGPWAGRTADFLIKNAARVMQYNPFEEGRFKPVAGDRAVFYTERIDPDSGALQHVVALAEEAEGTSLVTAQHGRQAVDAVSGERAVVLEQGYRYVGKPGAGNWDVMRFDRFTTRVAPPEFIYKSSKERLKTTRALRASTAPGDKAELARRVAAPLSVFILTLLAVPLAHIGPRQGRYGKLVLGILAYLLYSQLVGLGQAWIAKGKLPVEWGLWWVHGLMLAWALVLIGLRAQWFSGWRIRRLARSPA